MAGLTVTCAPRLSNAARVANDHSSQSPIRLVTVFVTWRMVPSPLDVFLSLNCYRQFHPYGG
jgi:hypothetical protein